MSILNSTKLPETQNKQFRHEIKLILTPAEYLTLRSRLCGLLAPDVHMNDPNGYLISSLYLEDVMKSAYYEKLSGVNHRKKYRIRTYNGQDTVIHLEVKEKQGDRIYKRSTSITRGELDGICANDFSRLSSEESLCREVNALSHKNGLQPYVIVRYLREAYVHPISNVRITFDKEISAAIDSLDLFDQDATYRPIFADGSVVLEVKYDEYFPKYIAQCLAGFGSKQAVSKYVYCVDLKKAYFHA